MKCLSLIISQNLHPVYCFFANFLAFMRSLWYDRREKTLGLCPKPCLGDFLRRSPLRTFKTFNQFGFFILSLHGANFGVAVFRTTISGCSRAKSRRAGFWRLSPRFRYRIEMVGELVADLAPLATCCKQGVALLHFALIRRLRRHLPPRRGRLSNILQIPQRGFKRLDMFRYQYFKAKTKEVRTIAFPFEGEGVTVGDG